MFHRAEEFERTALPHLRGLLRFARRLSGNPAQAEDLVQETYLLAWRGFHGFTADTNVRAWLFRILINAHRQAGRRRPALTLMRLPEPRTQNTHVESLEILDALDRLPEEQRVVLNLCIVEGFTGPEVSGILEVPLGTVMSRLSRGRQALRTMLAPRLEKVSR